MNFSLGGLAGGLLAEVAQVAGGKAGAASHPDQGASVARHARLTHAAQEFEASLMQEMLKPMRSKDALFADGETGSGSDGESDGGVLQSFGTQAMAEAMAKQGGMGIAKQVVRQVERQYASEPAARATLSGASS